jgi:hypothetical protein
MLNVKKMLALAAIACAVVVAVNADGEYHSIPLLLCNAS